MTNDFRYGWKTNAKGKATEEHKISARRGGQRGGEKAADARHRKNVPVTLAKAPWEEERDKVDGLSE